MLKKHVITKQIKFKEKIDCEEMTDMKTGVFLMRDFIHVVLKDKIKESCPSSPTRMNRQTTLI